jgi:hypothetical protein
MDCEELQTQVCSTLNSILLLIRCHGRQDRCVNVLNQIENIIVEILAQDRVTDSKFISLLQEFIHAKCEGPDMSQSELEVFDNIVLPIFLKTNINFS